MVVLFSSPSSENLAHSVSAAAVTFPLCDDLCLLVKKIILRAGRPGLNLMDSCVRVRP